MILIGLTGGIAVGKSTVCNLLKEQGIFIIDCDNIVRELQRPNMPAVQQIRDVWPQCVDEHGVLLRDKLGEVVFADATARRKLASIMNSKIFLAVMKQIAFAWWRCCTRSVSRGTLGATIVIIDAPILYESKTFLSFVSGVVVVSCGDDQQLARLVSRNPELGHAEASNRIAAQMPLAEKRQRAGFVIHNTEDVSNGDLTALEGKVRDAIEWMARQPHVNYPWVCASSAVAVVAAAVYALLSVRF